MKNYKLFESKRDLNYDNLINKIVKNLIIEKSIF